MRRSPATLLAAAALAAALLPACEKDTTTILRQETGSITGQLAPTTISAFGVLTDVDGQPVAEARVRGGESATTTNADGYWRLEGVSAGVSLGRFRFEADGFLDGSRNVYAQPGATYELDVQLLSDAPAGTVDAAAGGTVQLDGGASVAFGGGAFAKTDGTLLDAGEVSVVAHFLDAGDAATYVRMPGDLRGRPTDASSATDLDLLTSYGMMAVELRDGTGAPVQLAEGQTATLRMPVPAAALDGAPVSIPLWFFDEELGVWVEEGSAQLRDGAYVGEVSHFTFWNCDIPTRAVQLCGRIQLEGADPTDSAGLANIRLAVQSRGWGTRGGYTSGDGSFCGLVPAGEALTLLVYGACEEPAARFDIGSLAADTDLGTLDAPADRSRLITVAGSATCDGAPVTSGSATVSIGGAPAAVVALGPDGSFETAFVSCDASAADYTLVVSDYGSLSQSEPQTVSEAGTSVDFGAVESCEEALTDYLRISVDGREYLAANFTGGFSADSLFGRGVVENGSAAIEVYEDAVDLSAPGTFVVDPASFAYVSYGVDEREPDFPADLNFRRIDLGGQTFSITSVDANGNRQYVGRVEPWTQTIRRDSSNGGLDTTFNLAIDFSMGF